MKRPRLTTTRVFTVVALVVALPACGGPSPTHAEPPQASQGDPSWFAYDRASEYSVASARITVPVTDQGSASPGRLSCVVHRPAKDGSPVAGKFPGIFYNFTPYYARNESIEPDSAEKYFAERGYNVLRCDIPATGASPGEGYDLRWAAQDIAGRDAINWLGEQPWSSGKVGATGTSYGGWSALHAASTRPEHLTAVLTNVAPSDLYEQFVYPGGNLAAADLAWTGGVKTSDPDFATRQVETWRAHPERDAYWADLDLSSKLEDVNVPTMTIGGWYDVFRAGAIENYTDLVDAGNGDQAYLLMGPWTHEQPHEQRIHPVPLGAQLAWWDHWLSDSAAGQLPQDHISSFSMPAADAEGWTSYEKWPSTTSVELYASPEGGLSSNVPQNSQRTYDIQTDAGPATTCLVGCETPEDASSDNAGLTEGRVHFIGEPLAEEMHVMGTITADLAATTTSSSSVPLVVKIMDVAPDGRVTETAAGWSTLNSREDSSFQRRVVKLQSTDWTFKAGHQIQVTVMSGDYPKIDQSDAVGTVMVHTGQDGLTIQLPTAN